jgi:hypothetical protein
VGFQETKKESFVDFFLKYVHKEFVWKFLPANGTASGILVVLDDKKFEVIAWKIGTYSVGEFLRTVMTSLFGD